jgi:hypothetical protein
MLADFLRIWLIFLVFSNRMTWSTFVAWKGIKSKSIILTRFEKFVEERYLEYCTLWIFFKGVRLNDWLIRFCLIKEDLFLQRYLVYNCVVTFVPYHLLKTLLVQLSYMQHIESSLARIHNKEVRHDWKNDPSLWDTLAHRRELIQTQNTTGRTTHHYGIHWRTDGNSYRHRTQ